MLGMSAQGGHFRTQIDKIGSNGAAYAYAGEPQQPPVRLTQRWRTLQHITTTLTKIGNTARAALVLTQSSTADSFESH